MKNGFLKKLLPHVAALAVFLIIALLYCKPALEGKVLNQSDITNWKGAVNQSLEYAKTHDGKGPLWTNSVFSGMPAFQIGGVPYNNSLPWYVSKIMSLGLPEPVSFFFLASLCFYLLCVVLQINISAGCCTYCSFYFGINCHEPSTDCILPIYNIRHTYCFLYRKLDKRKENKRDGI